jgi:hypothetical protein
MTQDQLQIPHLEALPTQEQLQTPETKDPLEDLTTQGQASTATIENRSEIETKDQES